MAKTKAAKPAIELIYSQQATDYINGRAYANPRFFTTPRAGVSKVLMVGDWPKIRAAYEALGVPVEQVDLADVTAAPAAEAAKAGRVPAQEAAPALPVDERSGVAIPEDWRDLPWTGKADTLSLRQLAALVSDTPVLNKEQAFAAVEAELARREAGTLNLTDAERAALPPLDPTQADPPEGRTAVIGGGEEGGQDPDEGGENQG